jgi:tetratricopeptide (TPR) repeat protein/ADP-heptose:LPS heptosyltransferase
VNTDKTIQSAYKHYQAGRLQEAEDLYRKILKKKPEDVDALHFLGIIAYQRGDLDSAIKYIRKELQVNPSNPDAYNNLGLAFLANKQLDEAITNFSRSLELNPRSPLAHYNLGLAFQEHGRPNEAISCYRKAVQFNPRFVEAYNNLGINLRTIGNLDEALTFYQKALQLNPGLANTYNNLGLLLQDKGNTDEAITYYQKALQLNPNLADAYNNIGNAYREKGQFDQAIIYCKKALQFNPNFADAYNNLGYALHEKEQFNDAISYYQKALKLNPQMADAYNNLGLALQRLGQTDEAITYYQKALSIDNNFSDAYNNLGLAYHDKGQIEEALRQYQKALKIKPDSVFPHWNMSLSLLLSGNFAEGWKEYEWRWKTKYSMPRNFSQPLWDGTDINGKTILLHGEQGFGDSIQFIRYAPLVAARGAQIIIECQKELVSLLKTAACVEQVIAHGDPLPEFDVHCPLMSLPLVFNTNPGTIPAQIPYLHADKKSVQRWKEKLLSDGPNVKIGLAWAGRPTHTMNRFRSLNLNTFAPLTRIHNADYYSLQKGNESEQAINPPQRMRLINHTSDLIDFADTAALIQNLDLVISVDTAVAHLAGALGKPVWTLLPFSPDWRWMLKREDSPWYPTMRLFRQQKPGEWELVISKIMEALNRFLNPQTEQDEYILNTPEMHDVTKESSPPQQDAEKEFQMDTQGVKTGNVQLEKIAIVLNCEGMGDCLYAMAAIKKLFSVLSAEANFVLFTHHPELFLRFPFVEAVYPIQNKLDLNNFQKRIVLFDTSKLTHYLVDTFDFISIPAGIGELSFREKQLEYFPVEEDKSEHFDVVINTSVTWPSRSWPIENWQEVADYILSQGYSVAVVGKNIQSRADNLWKISQGLKGCTDLTNKLSLDQTYYTIKNCGLFITNQNGLSVLSGATDTEIIVLDMSIEWSKRAIYRNEDPHYKVTYVKGNCMIYCCMSDKCPVYNEFRCIPEAEKVLDVVKKKLGNIREKKEALETISDMPLDSSYWLKVIDKKIQIESECHPHCPEEKAYLYHTFDNGGTEIETLVLLRSLIRLFRPDMILETGTWQSDGTIALGLALKENGSGKLISLEINPQLAEQAKRRINSLGLTAFIEIINQSSLDYIDSLDKTTHKFDFAFFDSASNIRPIEFLKLYKKGLLTDLIAFHDTSRLRERSLIIPNEPQNEYVKNMDNIEHKYCRGGIEFPCSRGVRIMQLRRDINPAFNK